MTYAKLKNGKLEYPPINKRNEDGSTTLRYDRNIERLIADGYKPVIAQEVEYDAETQALEFTGEYVETDDAIVMQYTVRDKTEEEMKEYVLTKEELQEG